MGDVDGIMNKLIEFNDSKKKVDISSFRSAVEKQVNMWVGERSNIPLTAPKAPDGGPISIGDLMGGILFQMQRHGLALRGDVASTLLTISISEGLIRQLDPEFDMCRGAMKYFITFNDSAYSVIPTTNEAIETASDMAKEVANEVVPDLPDVESVLDEATEKVKDALPDILKSESEKARKEAKKIPTPIKL